MVAPAGRWGEFCECPGGSVHGSRWGFVGREREKNSTGKRINEYSELFAIMGF